MHMNSVISKHIKALFSSLALLTSITLLIIVLFMVSFYSNAQALLLNTSEIYAPKTEQIKVSTNNEFMLSADYYAGDNRAGGVIVLHDCDNKRGVYSVLAENIAQQGLHTLLVDLRGYGDSVSEAYSREEAKNKASDIVGFQSEMATITAHWADDLLAVYQFLAKKIDKSKGVAVVASGCSAAYAIALADQVQLNAIVMITPKMAERDEERYKNLIDIPSYFITSVNHHDSYETTQELFTWNGEQHSKMQVFKGAGQNYQLIYRNKYLANDIALWLKSILN